MEITALPFNRFLGLQPSTSNDDTVLVLPDSPDYLNHLGTVHASAQLALAEATSGEFLLRNLPVNKDIVPVVRRLEAKFKRPATGTLTSQAGANSAKLAALPDELISKGRSLIEVHVNVFDASAAITLTATVEWFLAVAK